jgi:serine/threonine protein kinase
LSSRVAELNEKSASLLSREDDLVQREAIVRSKEAELKRKWADMESRLDELSEQRSKYDKSEKQLRKMVDAHNKNEFISAMCVVTWQSITLKTKLGSGSFAAVYRGVWRGSQVAVKKPFMTADNPNHGLTDSDSTDLFCREVKLLSKLRHPNIVLLMAACMEPENMCMIMELCRSDLYTVLQDPSIALTPKKLIGFAIDATQALLYMHTHSPALLHRDVKTSNMLVSPSGEVKLIDFGYASFVGETDFVYTRHRLAEKANKGTPAYMAPECLKNEEVTAKSDIFSLGTVFWELLSRKIPWSGKSPESIYAEVTTGNRLPIPDDPSFPPAFGELISACWLESAADRPSARTVLKALRGIRKAL